MDLQSLLDCVNKHVLLHIVPGGGMFEFKLTVEIPHEIILMNTCSLVCHEDYFFLKLFT